MRREFLSFRRQAKRLASSHLQLLFLPEGKLLLSVVVPAKVSKLATTRNWLRRLVYDSLWQTLAGSRLVCVVIFKPIPMVRSAATQTLIEEELRDLLASVRT